MQNPRLSANTISIADCGLLEGEVSAAIPALSDFVLFSGMLKF
jgi:hypothetical protein